MWHQLVMDVTAGEALIALGRFGALRERLMATVARGSGQLGLLAPAPRALLGLTRLADGDLAGAREWLDHARVAAGAVPLSGQRGVVCRSDAEVLLAEGRPAEAADQARAAIDHFVHCGHIVRAALARTTLAEALLRSGAVASARDQLGQANQALTAAGAAWLAEQTRQAQRRLGARLPRPSRPAGAKGPLTPREYEVAELVAEGFTNRDIATRLYLSPRTVDTHTARILTKLEVTTRAGVARRLAG
jgi:DNA-binding NarL/FixJ family response regulator